MQCYQEVPCGKWLGFEGGALLNGISAHKRETPESSLDPSTMWGPGDKIGTDYQSLDLGLLVSRAMRNTFFLLSISHCICAILLPQPEQSKTVGLVLLMALRENPSWVVMAAGNPWVFWLAAPLPCSLPPSPWALFPVCLCILLRTPVIGFRAQLKSKRISSQYP